MQDLSVFKVYSDRIILRLHWSVIQTTGVCGEVVRGIALTKISRCGTTPKIEGIRNCYYYDIRIDVDTDTTYW